MNNDKILYFLHIPKTAGTTFSTILEHYFDYDAIYPSTVWSELVTDMKKDLSSYRLFRGHFGYGLEKILNKPLVYITMLRDPIDRIISNYNHIKVHPLGTNWVKDNFISENETILQVLQNPEKKLIFMNEQTRELGLDLSEIYPYENLFNNLTKENNYLTFTSSLELDYNKLLENAKKRLSEFPYFGIKERFEDSLFLLYYTFGWRPMKIDYKLQIIGKTNKEILSEELSQAIQSCVYFDSQLYDFAKDLFECRFSNMVKDLIKKYFEYRFTKMQFNEMIYELLDKHYNSCIKITQNYLVDFDFKNKISGSGWYWREHQDGTTYRWTGPNLESTIDFILPHEKDLKIEFQVINEAFPDNFKQLNVNGNRIEVKKIKQDERKIIYEGFIPKNILRSKLNFTRFTFQVKQMLENQYPLGPIGIAINKIVIHPVKNNHN